MAQQVLYSTATSEVLQWQDTEKFNYAAPPSGTDTLAVTSEEWANQSGQWYVVNGTLTQTNPNALPQAQASQIALLQSAFQKAEQSPVSVTLASGVTASFGMTPHDWTKIVGLYSKYVAKGIALPSGYQIPDVNGVLQAVTVADIENLFNAGETQMAGAIAKLESLVGQVEAATKVATKVSDVQAIVW